MFNLHFFGVINQLLPVHLIVAASAASAAAAAAAAARA